MIHPQDGNKSSRSSDLPEIRTSTYLESKEDVALFVTELLTKLRPGETLQSITITKLGGSEGYYVTDVITYC